MLAHHLHPYSATGVARTVPRLCIPSCKLQQASAVPSFLPSATSPAATVLVLAAAAIKTSVSLSLSLSLSLHVSLSLLSGFQGGTRGRSLTPSLALPLTLPYPAQHGPLIKGATAKGSSELYRSPSVATIPYSVHLRLLTIDVTLRLFCISVICILP